MTMMINGDQFVLCASACPYMRTDCRIRFYSTQKYRRVKQIRARDVGWSVLDTAFRYCR
jgi:hypothetical protein